MWGHNYRRYDCRSRHLSIVPRAVLKGICDLLRERPNGDYPCVKSHVSLQARFAQARPCNPTRLDFNQMITDSSP